MQQKFTISDQCSPEQRSIFEALNKGLDTLGITADELDNYFRVFLMQRCLMIAESGEVAVVNQTPAVMKSRLFAISDRARQSPKWNKTLTDQLGDHGIMEVRFTRPLANAEDVAVRMAAVRSQEPRMLADVVNGMNDAVGRFQDVDTAHLTPDQSAKFDQFKRRLENRTLMPHSAQPPFNLLQNHADGKPLFNAEGKYHLWDISDTHLETGTHGYYTLSALMFAVNQAARDKGISQSPALDDILETLVDNQERICDPAIARQRSGSPQPAGTPAKRLKKGEPSGDTATGNNKGLVRRGDKAAENINAVTNLDESTELSILIEALRAHPALLEAIKPALEHDTKMGINELNGMIEFPESAPPNTNSLDIVKCLEQMARAYEAASAREKQEEADLKKGTSEADLPFDASCTVANRLAKDAAHIAAGGNGTKLLAPVFISVWEEVTKLHEMAKRNAELKPVADALLANPQMLTLEYMAIQSGKLGDQQAQGKRFTNARAQLLRTRPAIENILELAVVEKDEGVTDKVYEPLAKAILDSPTLLVCATGNRKLVDKTRTQMHNVASAGKFSSTEVNAGLIKEALEEIGINKHAIDVYCPPPQLPAPVIESAQAEQGLQTPAMFTNVVAAENGSSHAKTDVLKIKNVPVPRPLTQDEIRERSAKRENASAETQAHVLAEANMWLQQALSRGFDRFECRIVNKPGFPIVLQFSKETGEGAEKKIEKMSRVLGKYDEAYTQRHIPLTLSEAVVFASTVQSFILNQAGVASAIKPSASRGTGFKDLDRFLPSPIADFKTAEVSGGMYSFGLKGPNPSSRRMEMTDINIPLGLAVRDRTSAEEKRELEERMDYILNLIDRVEKTQGPSNSRCFIKKRDVMEAYKSWLAEEGREWVTAERCVLPPKGMRPGQFETLPDDEKPNAMDLEGFHKNNLLAVSPHTNQKISLAPVSLWMDRGGDNPSWHADIHFHLGDKNSPSRGEEVRARILHLHTRDQQLAIARTWESLTGIRSPKTGETIFPGLFQQLRNLAIATGQEWQVENENTPAEQIIVCRMSEAELASSVQRYIDAIKAHYPIEGISEEKKKENQKHREISSLLPILLPAADKHGVVIVTLQHMLDDMRRYERDLGVEKVAQSEPDAHGNIIIKLQATRSRLGDNGGTVNPNPEFVYENESGVRKPIAFNVPIPANQADKIPAFVDRLNRKEVGEFAETAASSVEIKEGFPIKRKSPTGYRVTQVRECLKEATEKLYSHEEVFGHPLSKDWCDPKIQTALMPDPNKEEKAHYRRHRPNPIEGEDRFARYVRRPRDPWHSLS